MRTEFDENFWLENGNQEESKRNMPHPGALSRDVIGALETGFKICKIKFHVKLGRVVNEALGIESGGQ